MTYRHRAAGAACAGLDYIDEENYSEGYGASYGDYTVFVNTCIPASDDYEEALARSAHYLSLVKKDGRPIARLSRYDLPKLDTGRETNLRGDHTAKLRDLRPLAEQGDANAQYNLGEMYFRGQGVPKDRTVAAKWYRLAAKQGLAGAQHRLGFYNLIKNDTEAVKWFRLAAEQGYPPAQYVLGSLYKRGQGVPQDYAEAVKWFRLAAEQGNAGSQYYLGSLYAKGQGVPQEYVEAYKWTILAAAQGDKAAKRRRDIIAAKLSPGQIAEAERKASEWLEAHPK